MGLKPASVRLFVGTSESLCVHTFKHEYLCTSRLITTKFYLKLHWGGGKAASGFGLDRIGTLVSMAMDSSDRL